MRLVPAMIEARAEIQVDRTRLSSNFGFSCRPSLGRVFIFTFFRRRSVMRRRGLTLVEVVVVIFLLIILIGLMLPSVHRVRDGSSARTQTNNNLKQCALAVHN